MNMYFYGYLQFQMMQNITGLCVVRWRPFYFFQPASLLFEPQVSVWIVQEAFRWCGWQLLNVPLVVTHQSYEDTSQYSPCICRSETCTKYLCKTIVVHNPWNYYKSGEFSEKKTLTEHNLLLTTDISVIYMNIEFLVICSNGGEK
jgi:hypothetical protein